MAIVAYPLNNITYQAEDAMLMNLPYSSGIYGQDGNFVLTRNGMNMTVSAGLAFIRYSAIPPRGFTVYNDEPVTLTLSAADGSLPRVDRIVLRWRSSSNSVAITVLQGTASSTPTPVVRSTTASVYDLVLYDVTVRAGATSISAADVTDQRLNPSLCGLMANQITAIDTTAIETQIATIAAQAARDVFVDPTVISQYTPTRGVDYWTQADQNAIVAEVIAAMVDVSTEGQ